MMAWSQEFLEVPELRKPTCAFLALLWGKDCHGVTSHRRQCIARRLIISLFKRWFWPFMDFWEPFWGVHSCYMVEHHCWAAITYLGKVVPEEKGLLHCLEDLLAGESATSMATTGMSWDVNRMLVTLIWRGMDNPMWKEDRGIRKKMMSTLFKIYDKYALQFSLANILENRTEKPLRTQQDACIISGADAALPHTDLATRRRRGSLTLGVFCTKTSNSPRFLSTGSTFGPWICTGLVVSHLTSTDIEVESWASSGCRFCHPWSYKGSSWRRLVDHKDP